MAIAEQRSRLVVLSLYVGLLFVASRLALGTWLPPAAEKGLWFYSGLAAILLGSLLVTPFFTKPADAISYAVSGLVALLAVGVWSYQGHTQFERFLWLISILYMAAIVSAGIVAIAGRDSGSATVQRISRSSYAVADTFGAPRWLFSVIFWFALVTYHRAFPREYLVIAFAWALLVGVRPLEALVGLVGRLLAVWRAGITATQVGQVVAHQAPGLVLVRVEPGLAVSFGDVLVVRSDDGKSGLALALDYVGFAEGPWLRALHLPLSVAERGALSAVTGLREGSTPRVLRADPSVLEYMETGAPWWVGRKQLVGIVAPETTVSRLRIDLVRTETDLEEGRLVQVDIGPRKVLYQVIAGLTREEIIQQKNTRGYVTAEARKIGTWAPAMGRFEVTKWVPKPNAPVFLVEPSEARANPAAIGYVPQTSYPLSVEVQPLVTHNAAILGILGSGKSFLAMELVERMLSEQIRVICFDLTNQYADGLSPFVDQRGDQRRMGVLRKVARAGKEKVRQNVEEGGSLQDFRRLVTKLLRRFLDPACTRRLLLVDPASFEVWRQDSKPYQNRASMASLTVCEVVRIFSEAALEVVHDQGMAQQARCCLILEEAHSLIPEWNAVATEGDKTATNGTAKAILQGRKYGLGCLVVTQRTANVTKSILNQCNTIFALRVFDATGMEFLKNYIGEDYAAVLSTLEDRHAVVFGRASSCRNPILVRLNDRDAFLRSFRQTSSQLEHEVCQ